MGLQVRGMTGDDLPEVQRLIEIEWEAGHPVATPGFFKWQYSGFGPSRGLASTALAFSDGSLVGMRGVIPGLYQIPLTEGGYEVCAGGSFAMWLVAKNYRGQGIGGALLDYCTENLDVSVALGSNEKTSVPIYLKAGFKRLEALNLWFAVLDKSAKALLFGGRVDDIVLEGSKPVNQEIPTQASSPESLETLWNLFSREAPVFSLYRSSEFWEWRYFNHPEFDYKIFVDKVMNAVAVTRVENVEVRGQFLKVLRIVEYFTSGVTRFDHEDSWRQVKFIQGVLAWANSIGCVAADFRCSDERLGAVLNKAGFSFRRHETFSNQNFGFAGQLNPLVLAPRPINLHWKLRREDLGSTTNLYFTKSDNDMDRPNRRGQRSRALDS